MNVLVKMNAKSENVQQRMQKQNATSWLGFGRVKSLFIAFKIFSSSPKSV
jgi:hypothetical protein